MEALFPPTTVVKITSDQSEDIHEMVSEPGEQHHLGADPHRGGAALLPGGAQLAFVAISIPTSMLLSFMVLSAWASP
jgi:hypothetical protein